MRRQDANACRISEIGMLSLPGGTWPARSIVKVGRLPAMPAIEMGLSRRLVREVRTSLRLPGLSGSLELDRESSESVEVVAIRAKGVNQR